MSHLKNKNKKRNGRNRKGINIIGVGRKCEIRTDVFKKNSHEKKKKIPLAFHFLFQGLVLVFLPKYGVGQSWPFGKGMNVL